MPCPCSNLFSSSSTFNCLSGPEPLSNKISSVALSTIAIASVGALIASVITGAPTWAIAAAAAGGGASLISIVALRCLGKTEELAPRNPDLERFFFDLNDGRLDQIQENPFTRYFPEVESIDLEDQGTISSEGYTFTIRFRREGEAIVATTQDPQVRGFQNFIEFPLVLKGVYDLARRTFLFDEGFEPIYAIQNADGKLICGKQLIKRVVALSNSEIEEYGHGVYLSLASREEPSAKGEELEVWSTNSCTHDLSGRIAPRNLLLMDINPHLGVPTPNPFLKNFPNTQRVLLTKDSESHNRYAFELLFEKEQPTIRITPKNESVIYYELVFPKKIEGQRAFHELMFDYDRPRLMKYNTMGTLLDNSRVASIEVLEEIVQSGEGVNIKLEQESEFRFAENFYTFSPLKASTKDNLMTME